MPQVLKGDLTPVRREYDWTEIFDGKSRIFRAGKDFGNKSSFISTVHQAARRQGLKVITLTEGKDIKVQAKGAAKAKAPRKAAKKAAKAPAKRKPAKRAVKRVAKAKVEKPTNSVAATVN